MSIRVIGSLAEVEAARWDALTDPDDPFTEHAFLSALERAGCVGRGTGWEPRHLLYHDDAGDLAGAMPLYLKDDSQGEYIFDFGWAEAAHASGVPYYPKLTAAVPFTPVPGRRLLIAPGEAGRPAGEALLAGARKLADDLDAQGVHMLFCTEQEQRMAAETGRLMPRLSHQFHWHNRGYEDFEHYLGQFRSRMRKNTRKERRRAAALGYRLRTMRGPDLTPLHWQSLYQFYRDTTGRKWGDPYLNHAFFQEARDTLDHRVVVTLAEDGDTPVAGALFLQRGGALYGRYWGTLVNAEFLHFELCFYMPMELCIREGWRRYEAGAQGIQKLRRGMMPCPTYSAHWLRHPGLALAVDRHLARERPAVRMEIQALAHHGPFRRDEAA